MDMLNGIRLFTEMVRANGCAGAGRGNAAYGGTQASVPVGAGLTAHSCKD